MNNRIISTVKTKRRSPFIAVISSLLFVGMGQIYNGSLLKGTALFILRLLSFLIIPLIVQFKYYDSYIGIFASAILFAFIITIASPVEALYFSIKKERRALKKYNSAIFYLIFSVINITATALGIASLGGFFKIEKFTMESATPLFKKDDMILINKFNLRDYRKGELVIYNKKNQKDIGRILAKEGDRVKIINNYFYINDVPIALSSFNDSDMAILQIDDYSDIISESINGIAYPVKTFITERPKASEKTILIIKKKKLLIVKDNRKSKKYYDVIERNSIRGRVEGIIFSKNYKRILLRPHIIKKLF